MSLNVTESGTKKKKLCTRVKSKIVDQFKINLLHFVTLINEHISLSYFYLLPYIVCL